MCSACFVHLTSSHGLGTFSSHIITRQKMSTKRCFESRRKKETQRERKEGGETSHLTFIGVYYCIVVLVTINLIL